MLNSCLEPISEVALWCQKVNRSISANYLSGRTRGAGRVAVRWCREFCFSLLP